MGVNKNLGGSPESEKEKFPYAEIFEYKVLSEVHMELGAVGIISNIESSGYSVKGVPQFVLYVTCGGCKWRVWLYDSKIFVRDADDVNVRLTKRFDLSDPSSISNLFEFIGV